MSLVTQLYQAVKAFPAEELYGLSNQLRRAAVSVPSNIAEGAARNSPREFIQFLYIALGSLAEIETQVLIARSLGYLQDSESLLHEVDSLRRMTKGLITSIKERQP